MTLSKLREIMKDRKPGVLPVHTVHHIIYNGSTEEKNNNHLQNKLHTLKPVYESASEPIHPKTGNKEHYHLSKIK